MLNWIKSLFAPNVYDIKIGSKWKHTEEFLRKKEKLHTAMNPWYESPYREKIYEVEDIKKGYVKYRLTEGTTRGYHEICPISRFVQIYEEVKDV
jgi:hypothetical protein